MKIAIKKKGAIKGRGEVWLFEDCQSDTTSKKPKNALYINRIYFARQS